MKGISAVIAVILLLVITIALAGSAYMFISGIFTAKTAVVLSIADAVCPGDGISVTIGNDGTSVSGPITAKATQPDGTSDGGSCILSALNPGTTGTCDINRPTGATIGTYRLVASGTGATPTRGTVYCSTTGT